MPVIIPPESYDHWLGTLDPDPRGLLTPFPSGLMTAWPISTRVNKAENDDANRAGACLSSPAPQSEKWRLAQWRLPPFSSLLNRS